jgi:hypothetical protein
MAVAFDAFSSVAEGTGTLSWTHTPVGTPRGVRVDIVENGGTNGVSSVTYGGVAMELVSVNAKSSGEAGTVITYFLGKSIPTGAQTVSVTVGDAVAKRAGAITLTASADTCWISADPSISSDSLANPTSTLNLLGKTCFVSLAGHSGQNAVTGTTQTTGWTNRLEHDFGNQTAVWYTYNTISTSNVACGWTQTADDAVMVALAITEAPLTTDSASIGLTESASKTVVFDSRALPILLVESTRLSVVLSASDACAVGSLEELAGAFTIPAVDSLSIRGSDASSVSFGSTLSVSVTDSLAVVATTEQTGISASLISASDTILVGFNEVKEVINTQTGAVVVASVDALSTTLSEVISNLFVGGGGATQNITVSDSFRVALNGSGTVPISIAAVDSLGVTISEPSDQQGIFGVLDTVAVRASDSSTVNTGSAISFFSVTDTCSVSLVDVSSIFANTILTASDSCRVSAPEDVPDVATVLSATDSLRVTVTEPQDQSAQLSASDSLKIGASDGTAVIGGLLTFFITDSIAVQASEATSFGLTAVKTVESLSVQCSEVLTNSATVSAVESVRAQAAESITMFKALLTPESVAVQFAETAQPIFNSFVNLNAVDACAVQISESISQLTNFLLQLTASDSLAVVASDLSSDQSVTVSATDLSQAQVADDPSVAVTQSIVDTLAVRLTEAGLAIPIITVNVSTFAGDTILGFSDTASIAVLSEDLTKFVSDSVAVQNGEAQHFGIGYYADELCSVGVSEASTKKRVANRTKETWNGNTSVEHKHDQPRPGKYNVSTRRDW